MSGQNAADDAARLEMALQRIARAAAEAEARAYAMAARRTALHDAQPQARTPADTNEPAPDTTHIKARLDALIADVRGALGEG